MPRWFAQTSQWLIVLYTLHVGALAGGSGGGPGAITVGGGILIGHNPITPSAATGR